MAEFGNGAVPAVAAPALELPFKPFTFDEVRAITGVSAADLDVWAGLVKVHRGSGATGLDWMGAFAVYVASRYREEGAPQGRPEAVLRFVAGIAFARLTEELAAGNSLVALPSRGVPPPGLLVPVQPSSTLGRRLNLKQLLGEFKARLAQVFPNG